MVQHVAAMATKCHSPFGLQMSLKWSMSASNSTSLGEASEVSLALPHPFIST